MGKKIKIIGCGPGDRSYLTYAATMAIDSSDVIVGSGKLLDMFPESMAQRIPLDKNLSQTVDRISELPDGRNVAVLVTGDPGLFSLANLVIKKFGAESCEIIPGISSVQVAFARLGMSWDDAKLISAHKQVPDVNLPDVLKQHGKVAIFASNDNTARWVRSSFSGAMKNPVIVVCENLTLVDEKITWLGVDALQELRISSSTIIILLDK
ncbi:MAG: precorrin-6y C5,15-methyltransferase (decarboxylating) subunit CbiE [Desulfomonilaceae bacterium]